MPFLALIAQAAVAAAPVAAAPAQGVTTYPAAFFAEYRPNTALDMVNRLPGFSLDEGDSVRGFEGAAGNVLIDGARPASKSDGLGDILNRIQAGQVERIEVIRGGAPGVDMQGKTVIANVVRKKGGGARGLLQMSEKVDSDFGRSFIGIRAEGSGNVAGGAWDASIRTGGGTDDGTGHTAHTQLDPDGRLIGRSAIKAHAEVRNVTSTAAYEHPLAGGKLRVNGRAYYEHYRFNEANVFDLPEPDVIANEDGQERVQTEIGLRYDRDLSRRTKLEVVGLRQTDWWDYHSNGSVPLNSFNFGQVSDTAETIGRTALKFRQNDRLSWEAGGEVALNTLDGDMSYQEAGVAIPIPSPQVEVEEKRGEIFGKAVWLPRSGWTLEASVREEGSRITADSSDPARPAAASHTEKTLYYTKPRAMVTWQARPTTELRARFERVVGQLDFNDFVASASLNEGVLRAGNVDLVPEQAWVSEAAIEQRFWDKGAVVVTVRHLAISDTIDRAPIFDPSGVYDAPANIGEGVKDEIEFNLNLPLDRFHIRRGEFRAWVIARRSEVTDPTTGQRREISGLRPLEWEAHYSQQLPRWKTSYGVDAYGAWRRTFYRFNEVSTDKLRTYVVLYGEWKPRADLTLRAEVQNVTSRGFRRTRDIYAGPRGAYPLQLRDDRDVDVGPLFLVSVRKNFGG